MVCFFVGLAAGYFLSFLSVEQWIGLEERGSAADNEISIEMVSAKSNQKDEKLESKANEDKEKKEDKQCSNWVDIGGAVISPGVYCINDGGIVNDAVKQAGGIYKDVYAYKFVSQHVNLAEKVAAGQKIYIPFQEDVICKRKEDWDKDPSEVNKVKSEKKSKIDEKYEVDTDLKSTLCISLNKASKAELEELSGVGPSTAEKIVEGRPYAKIEDLLEVSGIGEATLDKIREDICL